MSGYRVLLSDARSMQLCVSRITKAWSDGPNEDGIFDGPNEDGRRGHV